MSERPPCRFSTYVFSHLGRHSQVQLVGETVSTLQERQRGTRALLTMISVKDILAVAAVTFCFTLTWCPLSYGWQSGIPRSCHVGTWPSKRPSLLARQLMNEDYADRTTTKTKEGNIGVEEYKNAATSILSNFMQNEQKDKGVEDGNPLAMIDWQAPKIDPSTSIETMAAALDYELTEKEWFVTGQANPSYFSDAFEFQDPDVKLTGIQNYCQGVNKLFNQDTSRAEILSTAINTISSTHERPVITCTWRLSGGVDVGPGLTIKPYIVYTDFVLDPETKLIVFQEDRFDIPQWDILLR